MKFGSSPDIESLVRLHYDAVYRFCVHRIGVQNAADVAQETFVTAQRVLSKFRGDAQPLTWLLGIAVNECRRAKRKQPLELSVTDFEIPEITKETEQNIVDREALQVALAGLSPEHREAVLLHELEGLSYDEVAGIIGVPVGTVKSRLHHAFRNLRRALFSADTQLGEVAS